MTQPEASPTGHDPERAPLIITTPEEKDYGALSDAATGGEAQPPATDYTSYSTESLYGILKVSVRKHPERGTETEFKLDFFAMILLMHSIIIIALIVFMYYAYLAVANEYGANSRKLDSASMPA